MAPIDLNATGGAFSTSVLELSASVSKDAGGNHADFSYQVVPASTAPNLGQINLGAMGGNNDGTGFAALGAPQIVGLLSPAATATLALLRQGIEYGSGGGDHLTLGAPDANNTLTLLNPIDLNVTSGSAALQRLASIRGTGSVPEGQFSGAISNTGGVAVSVNMNFDGNGGLIFASSASSYLSQPQINGGAVFLATGDPAAAGQAGPLGAGAAAIQIGSTATTAAANLGFMTYGPSAGVGPAPTIAVNRGIVVGGPGVSYSSAVVGGFTNDYTAFNGPVTLNGPVTFTAGNANSALNGGRVDINGAIGGSGPVTVGNATVEGDAKAAGIPLYNNGAVVFSASNTYSGATLVDNGELYVNGSLNNTSSVSVAAGATLGGKGTVNAPVAVQPGGSIEAGQLGAGTLTLNGGLTFAGAGSINFNGLTTGGSPRLVINGSLSAGASVAINVTGGTLGAGTYPLMISGNSLASLQQSLALPARGGGYTNFSGDQLDLIVNQASTPNLWTGAASSVWSATSATTNWSLPLGYLDNPTPDAVVFGNGATTGAVGINSGDVHPLSVTFASCEHLYDFRGQRHRRAHRPERHGRRPGDTRKHQHLHRPDHDQQRHFAVGRRLDRHPQRRDCRYQRHRQQRDPGSLPQQHDCAIGLRRRHQRQRGPARAEGRLDAHQFQHPQRSHDDPVRRPAATGPGDLRQRRHVQRHGFHRRQRHPGAERLCEPRPCRARSAAAARSSSSARIRSSCPI